HANHPVAPESVLEKIRLGAADEILLLAVVRCVWLHDETLSEIMPAGAENGAVPVEIDLVRHVVERPDAVTLSAGERGLGTLQARRIGHRRIRLCGEMNLETPNRITVALDVFAALAVAGLARDPEFGYLR